MRKVTGKLLVIALAIAGCSRSSEPVPVPALSTIDPATAQLTCNPPKRLCPTCNGGQICALRCPECAPPVAPALGQNAPTEAAVALVCNPPLRFCLDCTGQALCARFCPECPPLAAPQQACN